MPEEDPKRRKSCRAGFGSVIITGMKNITIYVVLAIICVLALMWAFSARKQDLPAPAGPGKVSDMEPLKTDIGPMNGKVAARLKTGMGEILLELDGEKAPITVGNFVKLAESGFYNGTAFHRVIPGFMIQGGDPLSKDPGKRAVHGTGDPGYRFADEINDAKIVRGSVAMANSGPDTNGSQFFIVTAEATPHLDGLHTNFGRVVTGMETVDAISGAERDGNDNPLKPITIESIEIQR